MLTRRALLSGAVAAGASAGLTLADDKRSASAPTPQADVPPPDWKIEKGRIRQSVVPWCFNPMPIEDLARAAAAMGMQSVELCPPEHWPMLKKHGLTCAIASSHGFERGWNNKANWDFCRERITKSIEAAGDFGCKNVITFSGMLGDLDEEEGKRNTIEGLKTVVGLAEKRKVNLAIEMLNTRVDVTMKGHPGYQCDSIEWAVDVCDAIGSDRVKILFDIYHVQIMQGDVITRIRQYKDYISHYHTAGVPGRNELDDRQEVNYPAIMRAIVETGYDGYVGQEFIPTWSDKVAALRHAAKLCDV